MQVQATGIDEQRARLAAMQARLLDLTPPLRVVAAELEKRTDDALDRSMSPAGEAFPPLATSTVIARARKQKSFSRKGKGSNRLTRGARAKRATAILFNMGAGPLGGTPFARALIDTGRLRKSQRARVVGQHVEWSAVGYLGPHITGGTGVAGATGSRNTLVRQVLSQFKDFQRTAGRPPKRNPTVFELRAGDWHLNESMARYTHRVVHHYVMTGEVVA